MSVASLSIRSGGWVKDPHSYLNPVNGRVNSDILGCISEFLSNTTGEITEATPVTEIPWRVILNNNASVVPYLRNRAMPVSLKRAVGYMNFEEGRCVLRAVRDEDKAGRPLLKPMSKYIFPLTNSVSYPFKIDGKVYNSWNLQFDSRGFRVIFKKDGVDQVIKNINLNPKVEGVLKGGASFTAAIAPQGYLFIALEGGLRHTLDVFSLQGPPKHLYALKHEFKKMAFDSKGHLWVHPKGAKADGVKILDFSLLNVKKAPQGISAFSPSPAFNPRSSLLTRVLFVALAALALVSMAVACYGLAALTFKAVQVGLFAGKVVMGVANLGYKILALGAYGLKGVIRVASSVAMFPLRIFVRSY